MRDYRKLECWHRAHQIALETCRVTKGFPANERFGLTAQMRRAAASVPMNIAEGAGRATNTDYSRFLSYAGSSLNELEYQYRLSIDLGYITGPDGISSMTEIAEVRAMLVTLNERVAASV